MKKTLVFLGHMDSPLSAAKYLKGKNVFLKGTVLVSMNRFTEELKRLTGLEVIYFENFLKKEDYKYMDDYVFAVSKDLHRILPRERNVSEFNNINIAKIMELEFCNFLCTAIKNLHVILNRIAEMNPSEVVLLGSKEEDRLEGISIFLNSSMNIKTSYVKIGDGAFKTFLSGLPKGIKQYASDIVSALLDKIQIAIMSYNKKYKGAVLMDYRFRDIVKGIEEEFSTISYVVAKGLNLRLKLLGSKKPYLSFLKMDKLLNTKRERRYFRKTDGVLKEHFSKRGNLRYKNYCIYDALRGIFKEIIERRMPFLRSSISVLYSFFRSTKPKIVVLRDSVRSWEYALISVARSLSVPSMVIQHGLLSSNNIYAKQNADSMALWGAAGVAWYRKAGSDISKSRVTGSPTHDAIHDNSGGRIERYENILRGVGANPKKPTIIYLANCIRYYPVDSVYLTSDLVLMSLRATLEAFRGFKDAQLIIKLHPYYDRGEYAKFRKEISDIPNVFTLENADIPDLFSGSIAVISEYFSSAIMDAIILKKPVIFYNFLKREEIIPLRKNGVGFEIKEPREIGPAIRDAFLPGGIKGPLSDENFVNFIKNYAYAIDGRSSERVKDFIKELVRA